MRLALMTEPQQGLTYAEILALASAAENAGLEAFFRSDHYASFPGPAGEPTTDAWTTLAGLARETARIGLGVLVSPVTFRMPGTFAKVVATVDEMSGGRVEVGMGAGWNEEEHRQLGIPFPPIGERYDMLEEAVATVHGLWTEPDGWSSPGPRWPVESARFATRPARNGRPHPPIIIGGSGGPRSARLAARFADEYNLVSATPERARHVNRILDDACAAIDRDPASLTRSAMTGVLVAETEAELQDRVSRQLEVTGADGTDAQAWLSERHQRWIMGTPDEASERLAALGAAGITRIMLQDFLPRDLEMVALMPGLAA